MAFEVRKINPLDIDPNTGVGIGLNFTTGGVFDTTYTTREATKNNLINYLLTGEGERVLNPTFGLGIQSYIFEQLNEKTEAAIEQDIQTAIQEFFPNVVVEGLIILTDPDTNQLGITLTYSIFQQEDTIEITLG